MLFFKWGKKSLHTLSSVKWGAECYETSSVKIERCQRFAFNTKCMHTLYTIFGFQ